MVDVVYSRDILASMPAGVLSPGYLLSKNIQDYAASLKAMSMAQRAILIFDILLLDPNYLLFGDQQNTLKYQQSLMLLAIRSAIQAIDAAYRPMARMDIYSSTVPDAKISLAEQASAVIDVTDFTGGASDRYAILFNKSVFDMQTSLAEELIAALGVTLNVPNLNSIQSELNSLNPASNSTFSNFKTAAAVLCSSFLNINDPALNNSLAIIFSGNPTGLAAFKSQLSGVIALSVSSFLSDYSTYQFGRSDPDGIQLRATITNELVSNICVALNIGTSSPLSLAVQTFVRTGFTNSNAVLPANSDIANNIQNEVAKEVYSQVIGATEQASSAVIAGHNNIVAPVFGISKIDYLMNLKRYLDQYQAMFTLNSTTVASLEAILQTYLVDLSSAGDTKAYLDGYF